MGTPPSDGCPRRLQGNQPRTLAAITPCPDKPALAAARRPGQKAAHTSMADTGATRRPCLMGEHGKKPFEADEHSRNSENHKFMDILIHEFMDLAPNPWNNIKIRLVAKFMNSWDTQIPIHEGDSMFGVITLATSKGGAGKSTLARSLA